ncbi:patatin-like phospholipase family protein [Flavicella marina]|uniref:patatin-like phospholipase family protein n=1 Tax=Flavicella marina TaxID=1475951 RepID=UPI001265A877|nr:patatin-like phospholipase family protein [Flavicella marina]
MNYLQINKPEINAETRSSLSLGKSKTMNIRPLLLFIILSINSVFSQEAKDQQVPKVGLVLSGGGAKGFAHIGVLKVIEQTGVKIDYIAGTSMGAVVGGLYASGYSSREIDSIINSYNFMNLLQDVVPRSETAFFEKEHGEKHLISFPITENKKINLPKAIAKGQSVYNEMNALFEHVHTVTDFSELPIPFFCMATDIETGESVVFDKGHLPEAIRASASLPTLLEPFEVDGRTYLDGGVMNNFPVDEMKAKGATIIIGVDVQGKLEKKENIKSVLGVLNQIIDFQMYAKDDEKVQELTVHIKPNTKDFSMTTFDRSVEIITEGEIAADAHRKVLDSIAVLQRKLKIDQNPKIVKERKKRKVTQISINELKHYSGAYIRGKMDLEFGDSISFADLNKKIDRLSTGNDFQMIKYKFHEINDEESELELDVKENKILSFARLGLHYDPLYKSSLLLNFTTKHMLIKNDIFSVDFVVGDNIRANLNYFVNNGIYTSYGLSSRFNTLNTNVKFQGSQVNQITKNYLDFTNLAYIQTTFNRKFAVGLGLEHKLWDVSTRAFTNENGTNEKFYFEKSNYFNSLAYIKLDSYDKKTFPKNGYYVNGEVKYYMASTDFNNNFSPFCQLKLKLSAVKTVINKFTFHFTAEGGTTFESNTSNQFLYALGGYGENMINNHIPFFGYRYEDNVNHSYLKGMFEVRYEIHKKHNIAFISNYGKTDLDIFNGGQVFQDVLSGYAFVYGYDSFLGPVKLVRDWSPDVSVSNWYLSVGLWF